MEQVQSIERSTELETLLSTNLLKQQQELQDRLSKADVSADRCMHTWKSLTFLAHPYDLQNVWKWLAQNNIYHATTYLQHLNTSSQYCLYAILIG